MAALSKPRHERFAQELAKGKSQADAYTAAGYKPSRSAAARLFADVNICERLAEIQNRGAERAVVTVADIAKQLDEDRAFARECGSAAASVAATMGKAKVLGLIVDKQEVGAPGDFSSMSDAELAAFVAREAGTLGLGAAGVAQEDGQAGVRKQPGSLH